MLFRSYAEVKEVIDKLELHQHDVADMAGIPRQTLSGGIGRNSRLSVEYAEAIHNAIERLKKGEKPVRLPEVVQKINSLERELKEFKQVVSSKLGISLDEFETASEGVQQIGKSAGLELVPLGKKSTPSEKDVDKEGKRKRK